MKESLNYEEEMIMKQKIINCLEADCEKNTNDMMKRTVCNYVVERLDGLSEDELKRIVDKKLTLSGAIEKMREAAKKIAVGGCGVLTDEEGFEIVAKYFGIKKEASEPKEDKKTVSLFDLI